MTTLEEFWFSKDGVRMHTMSWLPSSKLKGVIILIHGMGEHIGRYEHIGTYLNSTGYGLCGFDLRGHGKSGGRRGDAPNVDVMLNDIDDFVLGIRQKYTDLPYFIYGHSLGGSLVLNYIMRYKPQILGAIITCPGLKPVSVGEYPLNLLVVKLMNCVFPSLLISNKVKPEDISHDKNIVQAYIADPLVHNWISIRFALSIIEAGEWAIKNVAKIRYPVLFLQGGADRVVDVPTNLAFAKSIGDHCQIIVWPKLFHEIHNEPEKEEIFSEIESWLMVQTNQFA